MAETKTHLELTGLERFAHLEDRIHRVVEAFKTIRKENETLRAENGKLRDELAALRDAEEARRESVAHLEREREELRERVEKALALLAALEVR